MTFYENYAQLCAINGYSPSSAADEIGISRAAVTHWKSGAVPNYLTLKKVADFFGVDMAALTSPEGFKTQMGFRTEFRPTPKERELITAWRRASTIEKENVAFILRKTGFTYDE